jgi:hypothetical protein
MTTLEHIKVLAKTLSENERGELVEFLEGSPQEVQEKESKSLRGSWKIQIPEDFDIDKALKEIRSEWEEEIEEIIK